MRSFARQSKKTAFKVTRVGQLVAEASRRLGIRLGSSICHWRRLRQSETVAEILEEIGLERVGAPGTTAALALSTIR